MVADGIDSLFHRSHGITHMIVVLIVVLVIHRIYPRRIDGCDTVTNGLGGEMFTPDGHRF